MAAPDIPPGFDFTDPDIYTTGASRPGELAELRRAAPVWWVAQRRGSAGFDDEGYWAVTRHADIMTVSKTPRGLLVLGEHRADPLHRRHAPRVHRDAAADPAQHRPARTHQAARHRLPRFHPAGHRQPAPRPDRTRAAHRGHGARIRHRQLRRGCRVRTAAAGDLRTARRPARGPGQDLLLVEPDDRLRGAEPEGGTTTG